MSTTKTAPWPDFRGQPIHDGEAERYGQQAIGIKDGLVVFVSETALAQTGRREIMERLGMVRRYPVKTDLSGNIVMVEGDSHEDAVHRYLSRAVNTHQRRAHDNIPKK
jgi:hypothetical protein